VSKPPPFIHRFPDREIPDKVEPLTVDFWDRGSEFQVQVEGAQASQNREAEFPNHEGELNREVFLWVIESPDMGVEERQSSSGRHL
jgi:hypothetical protein